MQEAPSLSQSILTNSSGVIVFLFFSTQLLVPYGYGLPLLLALASIVTIRKWMVQDQFYSRDDIILFAAFMLFFVVHLFFDFFHDAHTDRTIRYLLAGMVMLFLIRYPFNIRYLWAGVALGGIVAGGWAFVDVFYLGAARASGHTNAIHFGNGALVIAYTCAAGIIWVSGQQNKRWWYFLLGAGAVMGLLASLLSGSRGGWITLPLAILAFFRFYSGAFSLRQIIVIPFLAAALFAFTYSYEPAGVKSRIDSAVSDVREYFRNDNSSTSIGYRLEMWRAGLLAFQEKPLLGWGREDYATFEGALIEDGLVNPRIDRFRQLHNQYVEELAKHGIVGLVSLLIFFLTPLLLFSRKANSPDLHIKALACAGTLSMIAYIEFNLTMSLLSRARAVMVFVFLIIFLWSALSAREKYLEQTDNKMQG
ncbi:O-antigen ligase family protein [Desulfurispirillum indicum]|uniref:O-antigen ligase family protein n=1 Tax=Desulfurispirillum indicum TaxID=936456 RepID=UPI001CFA9C47|nr:O-antigen ligase [Desulfurispirillum indicum]UCZ56940.1 O-antigen ligase family protein [Desulfurispirillum indicum]